MMWHDYRRIREEAEDTGMYPEHSNGFTKIVMCESIGASGFRWSSS